MSNNSSLRETKITKLPSPFIPSRHPRLSLSLHSTQRSGIFTPKFDHQFMNRKKSATLACEKKLKARIMEIISDKNETIGPRSNSHDIRGVSGHKYSRSYIHYKVICKEKTRESLPPKSDTLMKIRSICESKLISLPQKQSLSSVRKEPKQLCRVLPESPKVKIFTSKTPFHMSNIKHYRTQSYQIQGKQSKGKRSINFEPWNSDYQNEGDQLSGFLQL